MKAINYKFLNRSPLILGFEFFDCVQAAGASLVIFAIFKSHLCSLIIGFGIVVLKAAYKKLYPKNTLFFLRQRKSQISVKHLFSKKEKL